MKIILALATLGVCVAWDAIAQPAPNLGTTDGRTDRPVVVSDTPVADGPVVLSGGVPTDGEIAKFDAVWMTDAAKKSARDWACALLYTRFDAEAWEASERTMAMARMYQITRNPKYIDHFEEYVKCALQYRDDRHTGPKPGESLAIARYVRPRPLDQIRNRQGLPAWGGRSINSANLHRVDEVVSSLYAHSIASFARIVLEDPLLRETYGARAVQYTNAVIETIAVFLPQFDNRPDGQHNQGFLLHHPNLKNRWSEADCDRAFNDTIAAESPNAAGRQRYEKQLRNCKNVIDLQLAGKPMSHNENHAFAMAMIEVVRATGTEAYRQNAKALPTAAFWRGSYPIFVSRIQRYFKSKLVREGSAASRRYVWPHAEVTNRWEDASHAALSMQYVQLLARDFDALNAAATPTEPIRFETEDLRLFANTFLHMNEGPDMAVDVKNASPTNKEHNSLCFSWIDLSAIDQRVYDRCRERVLRVTNGAQDSLSIANHAALLANGRAH